MTISSEKRQKILQTLHQNRGNRNKIETYRQSNQAVNSAEERQKLLGILLEQQEKKERKTDKISDFSAKNKVKNRQQTKPESKKQSLQGVATLQKQEGKDKTPLPTHLLLELVKWIGSEEIDLNAIPLPELEQRRKEVQYRHDWLQALLKEVQRELYVLQTHMQERKEQKQKK